MYSDLSNSSVRSRIKLSRPSGNSIGLTSNPISTGSSLDANLRSVDSKRDSSSEHFRTSVESECSIVTSLELIPLRSILTESLAPSGMLLGMTPIVALSFTVFVGSTVLRIAEGS